MNGSISHANSSSNDAVNNLSLFLYCMFAIHKREIRVPLQFEEACEDNDPCVCIRTLAGVEITLPVSFTCEKWIPMCYKELGLNDDVIGKITGARISQMETAASQAVVESFSMWFKNREHAQFSIEIENSMDVNWRHMNKSLDAVKEAHESFLASELQTSILSIWTHMNQTLAATKTDLNASFVIELEKSQSRRHINSSLDSVKEDLKTFIASELETATFSMWSHVNHSLAVTKEDLHAAFAVDFLKSQRHTRRLREEVSSMKRAIKDLEKALTTLSEAPSSPPPTQAITEGGLMDSPLMYWVSIAFLSIMMLLSVTILNCHLFNTRSAWIIDRGLSLALEKRGLAIIRSQKPEEQSQSTRGTTDSSLESQQQQPIYIYNFGSGGDPTASIDRAKSAKKITEEHGERGKRSSDVYEQVDPLEGQNEKKPGFQERPSLTFMPSLRRMSLSAKKRIQRPLPPTPSNSVTEHSNVLNRLFRPRHRSCPPSDTSIEM